MAAKRSERGDSERVAALPEIAPCPWCKNATLQVRYLPKARYVCCLSCGAHGPSCMGSPPIGFDERTAILAWNRVAEAVKR